MSCKQYLNLIDDSVEGELDEKAAEQVDSHVFACRECREQYETLKREKEVYAHYLFDAEPPNHLWANFQTRLESEKEKTSRFAETAANVSARKTNIFGFRRFSALPAGAALIIVFGIGFGWLRFASNKADKDIYVAKTEPGDLRLPLTSDETGKSGTADSPVKINSGEKNAAPQINKLSGKYKSSKAENVSAADKKSLFAEAGKIGQKTNSADVGGKNAAIENRPDEEERRQRLQMRNLENEIAGQIERVELLLRSFRNAGKVESLESVETFDVAYEKGQARRLLEKNVRLRRGAESHGIADAEELLSRIEPYLLDIANLENNPAPGKVLDIKERVSSQNIIASLQVY